METNWDKVRQEMIEATKGKNPEELTISGETFQND